MELIDNLSNPHGLCVLTGQGEIAFYGADRALHTDTLLSEALRQHNRELLAAYLRAPGADSRRIALLHDSCGDKPWGRVTLSLDESVVRQMYPTGGRAGEPLTAFQRKNREKSVYRGIELLLDHRRDVASNTPAYFPVLFDRRTRLGQYAGVIGRELTAQEAATPVVEVLNLFEGVSGARPEEQRALSTLHERMRHELIRKEARHDSDLAVLDRSRLSWSNNASAQDAYQDATGRNERDVTLSESDLDKLHTLQRHELVERWLEIPYRPVDPGRLRQFVHFRDMDPAKLNFLTARSLVYTAPAGEVLLERGTTDKWNLYLLEGSVSLAPEDGATLAVEGASEKAATPIAFLKPRKYTVTSRTKVSFLWIHDVLLEVLRTSGRIGPPDKPKLSVGETMSDLQALRDGQKRKDS